MYNLKSFIFLLTILIFGCCTSPTGQTHKKKIYYGIDAELYKDTPAWKLVHALDIGNFELAKEEIIKDSSLANYVEPNYGNSVLFWAALNSNEKAVEFLLKSGAEVNKCNFAGDITLAVAAFYNNCESEILQMLLNYQPLNDSLTFYQRNEALVKASNNCLGFVKLLINYGADPTWISKNDIIFNTITPLEASILHEKYDIIEYFLFELNVPPSTGNIIRTNGDTVKFVEILKKNYNIERISDQEKIRQQIRKILDFVEKKE